MIRLLTVNRRRSNSSKLLWPVLMGLILLCFAPWLLLAWPEPGRQVIAFDQPPPLTDSSQLLIQGHNHHAKERILVIRLDDRAQPSYSDRINLERVIPPGQFSLQISLTALRTPSGRSFDSKQLEQIIVFPGDGLPGMDIKLIKIQQPPPLPDRALGWDLGPKDSAVWPGFSAISPEHPLLQGQHLQAIDRGRRQHAADPLVRDGIRGIESLRLPLAKGRWRITLWLRDSGEWEYVPHPLKRQISANGKTVYTLEHSPLEWIEQQYLAGREQPIRPGVSSWPLYGQRPRQTFSFEQDVEQQGVLLEFSGQLPEAGFVAAILAEPADSAHAYQQVQQDRAHWWQQNWPVDTWPAAVSADLPGPITLTSTANNWIRWRVQVQASHEQLANLVWQAPSFNGLQLNAELRFAHWRLRRTALSSTLLRADNRLLRSALPAQIQHAKKTPVHTLEWRISVPKQTPPGVYQGQLSIGGQQWPIRVQVLNIQLPEPDRPVGAYLESPVHFDWFKQQLPGYRQKALACDLALLRDFGLTGIAPPFDTPSGEQPVSLQQHLSLAYDLGFHTPILAYTPFKRLQASLGLQGAMQQLHRTEQWLRQQGLQPPIWVTADEPSNPGSEHNLEQQRRYAKLYAPTAKRAGHLNHATDQPLASAFDLVLINDGYGLNSKRLQHLQPQVWLYNLNDNIRLAAGFYLWRSGAQGYLQWHARMPTADPFDPTDGREDDAQLLYPMRSPCPLTADIDADLLDLADGIQDLRWLLWLEQQATSNASADQLIQHIQQAVSLDWQDAKQLTLAQLTDWRLRIIELARQNAEN